MVTLVWAIAAAGSEVAARAHDAVAPPPPKVPPPPVQLLPAALAPPADDDDVETDAIERPACAALAEA